MVTRRLSNPLPAGLYEAALSADQRPLFRAWRLKQPRARVRLVEAHEHDGKAHVTFAVFGRTGAYPFGRLGEPSRLGSIVGVTTGRQEKQVSPLPPGRYWLLVDTKNERDFTDWSHDMAGGVVIRTTATDPSTSTTFFLFDVLEGRKPFFPAERFGLPNHAPPNVTSIDDVFSAPPDPGLFDWLDTGKGSNLLPSVVMIGLLLWGLTRLSPAPRRRYA